MSILQFLRILWARRIITIVSTVSAVIGAWVVVQIIPPRWEGHSRVMLELIKPDPITGLQMNSSNPRPYISTQKELITDYSVVGPVVDRLGLTTDPIMISAYSKRPAGDQRDMRRWVAQFIMDRTRVENLDGSNILEITYAGPSPAQARAVADTLREAYIDATLASRRQQADKNADWFLVQADKVKAQLDQAQGASADYQRQNNIVLQDDKSDVESARLRSLASASGGGAMIAPSASASPSSMELSQVEAQIGQLSKTLGPNHPELIALKSRRAALQTAVEQEKASQKAAMAAAAGAGAGAVERAMTEQKAKVMANQDKISRALQLQGNVELLRQQFDKTASRAAELKQQAATVETGLTPLGNAVTPSAPSFPKVPLIMIGSLVMGIGGGVLMSLLVEFFARRVRCTEDLQALDGLPVLAVIAANPQKPRRRMSWFPVRLRGFPTPARA